MSAPQTALASTNSPPAWRAIGEVLRGLLFRLWLAQLIEARRHA